ncbi:Putative cytosolic protein (plasmid) [Borrelia crocidurae DOU]|uniref:Putative cytosolic protein n=2 Tax=Borrelia crocidurae TaxID=29520 RepID=W5SJ72_9SPIR|nr:Putative cytosolic protein [Borrelia crocidurae DOU]
MKMELYEEDYYEQEVIQATEEVELPKFYDWFVPEQIEEVPYKMGFFKTVEWDAFINDNPTNVVNNYNTVSMIGFRSEFVKLNYLRLQYKFAHLKDSVVSDYTNSEYIGDVNNNHLPFGTAYKLACNEIMKLITHFVLTGTVSVQKDGKNSKLLLPNMYGLLNMPYQIKEEVEAANKDKMEKIFEKIESGLSKLELGDYFDCPFMVLVDPLTSLKLAKPYVVNNSPGILNERWQDSLIATIKAVNGRNEVTIKTSNLLNNQIVIYPMNPKLLKFKPSKFMLPTPNEQIDTNSSDIAHSYIDFVLGGLMATQKTILQVEIKQS